MTLRSSHIRSIGRVGRIRRIGRIRHPAEWKTVGQHAITVMIGQLSVMALGLTDTIIAGHYSSDALAALSVAASVALCIFVTLVGVVQALLPVFAEYHGCGQYEKLGHAVRQSLYLSASVCAVGMWVLLSPDALLRATRVPPDMAAEVRGYLAALALALPSAMLFRLYATLSQALGRPFLVTWLQVLALLIKIPLSIVLVFGWHAIGYDGMGFIGCAWGTVAVNALLLLFAITMLTLHPLFRPLRLWQLPDPPQWALQKTFLRFGLPGGMAYLFEVSSFAFMALFIARLGTAASASHQIVANVINFLFMMPLSLGIAASARTSYWTGRNRPDMGRYVCQRGIVCALLIGCASAAAISLGRYRIPQLFTDDAAIIATTSTLMLLAAWYHVGDAAQAISAFLLRSYHITVTPVIVYLLFLWGVGLAGGYWLSYGGISIAGWHIPAQHSPHAFWIASATATTLAGVVLLARLAAAWRSDLRSLQSKAQPLA